jgi:hypothetical protein
MRVESGWATESMADIGKERLVHEGEGYMKCW